MSSMKTFGCRCAVSVIVWGSVLFAMPRPLAIQAQTPVLPPLLAAPEVAWDGRAGLTIRLPIGAIANRNRFRLGLYEAGRSARVAEVQRVFTPVGGAMQTQLKLEADPGRYEIRLISADKTRTPLSQAATLTVSGIERVPGAWLFNGSPFVAESANDVTAATGAPLFLSGLKRDPRSSKAPNLNIATPGFDAIWRVLELGDLSEIALAAFDAARWREEVARRLNQARQGQQRGFVGCALLVNARDGQTAATAPQIVTAMRETRRSLDAVAPEAALLLSVVVPSSASGQENVARLVDAAAPLCDGVTLQTEGDSTDASVLWPLKVARRVAEEQLFFDLPIFWQRSPGDANETLALEAWMSGASGLIDDADNAQSDETQSSWRAVVRRNSPLFIGAVTLEDSGILPAQTPLDGFAAQLYGRLRRAARVPLLARGLSNQATATGGTWRGRSGESLWTRLSPASTSADLDNLREAARLGGRFFIEGASRRGDADSEATKWDDALGLTSRIIATQRTVMTLNDPWIFGLARGTQIPVEQSFALTLKPQPPETSKTRNREDDKTPRPRVVATLSDGSPAIVISNFERGEIAWMPNRIVDNAADTEVQRTFLSAIASYIQPAIVRVRERANVDAKVATGLATSAVTAPDETARVDANDVRVALRASSKGTFLIGLFNERDTLRRLTLEAQSAAGVALDLVGEKELPLQTRGFVSTIEVDLPPNGWKLIALANSRRELDEERNAPRLKARFR